MGIMERPSIVPLDNQCIEQCNPEIDNPTEVYEEPKISFKEPSPELDSMDPSVVFEPKYSFKERSPKFNETPIVRTFMELSKSSWSSSTRAQEKVQPYLRGCKWSPDGTCCLTVVNNDGMHICELARDLYSYSPAEDRAVDVLDSVVHVKEAGLVYDFCWYPSMNSGCPESCCWITTLQYSPVQMWDAFDGSLRCSYRGFNAVDEMEPAISVIFTPDGSKIIAGYKKVLRTFDVNLPGRDCAEHKIAYPASCLAVHMDVLAVGSWNTSIGLYNISETGTYKSIAKIYGHSGGVTHMKFSPDGLYLVSGGRNDNKLLVWDIRYYRRPLNILTRTVNTNQRIYFDISPCGKQLISGGTNGVVKIWENWHSTEFNLDDNENALQYPLHNDCCNSLSIHPLRPILATGSGQYHLEDPLTTHDSAESLHRIAYSDGTLTTHDSDSAESLNSNADSDETFIVPERKYSTVSENSLSFWWIGNT